MPNRAPHPDTDAGTTPKSTPTTGAPRWVKVLGVVILSLAALLVGLKLTGIGPEHGPGRHGGAGKGTPASGSPHSGRHTPAPGTQDGGDRP